MTGVQSNLKTNFASWLLLLCLCASSRAQAPLPQKNAQDDCTVDPVCNEQYELGRIRSKTEDYAGALTAYQTAYALHPLPTLLYNIARMHHRLGMLDKATETYRAYIAQSANSDLRKKADDYLHEIAKARDIASHGPEASPQVPAPVQPPSISSNPEKREPVALHKKWWLWVAVGGAAAALAVGLGVGLGDQRPGLPQGINIYEPGFQR